MELRQTIRTGIRNIRRAWWEPGLMLAISALLVAAAWLWIPAPPGGEPGADGAAVYPSGQRDPWHGPLEAQNHGGAADGPGHCGPHGHPP